MTEQAEVQLRIAIYELRGDAIQGTLLGAGQGTTCAGMRSVG